MSHHHTLSTASSSYSPILINPVASPFSPSLHPASASRLISPSPNRPVQPRLNLAYPYPLPILSLLDVAYTYKEYSATTTPAHLVVLCVIRSVILGVIVGLSKRWRNRGGWIAGSSGITLGWVVWTFCAGLLARDDEPDTPEELVKASLLLFTALISAFEFITFVLLLRLSPPSHKTHPFALRLPNSAVQSATVFNYRSEPEYYNEEQEEAQDDSGGSHSRSASGSRSRRYSRMSRSASGRLSVLENTDHAVPTHDQYDFSDPEPEHDGEHGAYDENSEEEEIDDTSSTSSISESSIIDLPPPLLPARIIPPTSLSITRGLDVLAGVDLDPTPVLGLVRRSRSARFLARSWGSRVSAEGEGEGSVEEGRNGSEGYGTFGRR